MLVATGFFDNLGNPSIKMAIAGVFTAGQQPLEFDAIIDTGFSGFISMPLMKAFPLGLPLFGTTNVVFADGQQHAKLLASGIAKINNTSKTGLVILEPASTDILVGMDFLRTFEVGLHITSTTIELYDEKAMKKKAAGA
jgi:predicted aspartyl protease